MFISAADVEAACFQAARAARKAEWDCGEGDGAADGEPEDAAEAASAVADAAGEAADETVGAAETVGAEAGAVPRASAAWV